MAAGDVTEDPRALRTARLTLRAVTPEDAGAIVALSRDPRVNAHRPGGPPSEAEAQSIVAMFVADWARDGIGYWAVERGGALIGVAGVRRMARAGRPIFNLYYRFAPESWGEGLATETCRAALKVARRLEPERPVVASTRPANAPAIALALAIGLERAPELDGGGLIAYADR